MDLNKLARRCFDIDEWENALSKAGRIPDADRLNIVDLLITGKMEQGDKLRAMEIAMGRLGGMQNSERCCNWWDVVIEDQNAVRAAINAGLPFSSDMLESDRLFDILKRATKKDEKSAVLIWSSCSEKTREDITRVIFENMSWSCEPLFEESERWLDLLRLAASSFSVSDRREILSTFLVNRFSIFEPDTAATRHAHLSKISASLFPGGMKQDQVDLIKVDATKYSHHNYDAMAIQMDIVLAPLVSLDAKEILLSQTCSPKATAGSTGRRI